MKFRLNGAGSAARKAAAVLLALLLSACGGGVRPSPDGGSGAAPPVPPPPVASAGYIDDGADHGGRAPYLFSFLHEDASVVDAAFFAMMERWSDAMNFTLVESVFGGDGRSAVGVLDELSDAGVDGVVISASGDDLTVTNNYCNELGIPHVYVFNAPRGADGGALAPCVEIDMSAVGGFMVDWLDAHARKAWGEEYIPEKTGVIRTRRDDDSKLAAISEGVSLRARELYPETGGNMADASPSGGELTAETAYNAVYMAIITYRGADRWLIPCVSVEFGRGAAAAAETLGVSDKVAILSVEMEAVFALWDGSDAGVPGAAVAIESPANAGAALAGLIALRDGRAEPDALWSELKRPGDVCAVFTGRLRAVTRDEYADYRQYIGSLVEKQEAGRK